MKSQTPTANDNVSRTVRTLLAHRGQQQADLADHLDMDSGTMSRALNGKRRWTLDDIFAIAAFFDVPYTILLDDPETLVRNKWFRRELLPA